MISTVVRIFGWSNTIFRSVLKNTGWAAVGQMVAAGVTFLETIILARFLSLTDFGILVTLTATAELVYGLLDFRSGEAVVKFVPEIRASGGKRAEAAFLKLISLIDLCVSVFGFLIIAAVGRRILSWAGLQNDYVFSLLIISFALAGRSTTRSFGSYFRICGRFNQATIVGSVALLARLILTIAVALLRPSLSAFVIASAFANLLYALSIGLAFVWAFQHDGLEWHNSPICLVRESRRSIATFLVSTNFAGTLKTLSTRLDTLIIAGLTAPGMVAIYKMAARLSGTLLLFSDPLLVAVYPEISHLHTNGQISVLRRLIRNMTLILAAFAAVLVGGFMATGSWILGVLAGPEYRPAYPVVLVMFLGSALAMIFFWARPLLLVRGYAYTLVWIHIIALVLQFVALYGLVPIMGALGAGLALALYSVVCVGLFLFVIVTRTDHRPGGAEPVGRLRTYAEY